MRKSLIFGAASLLLLAGCASASQDVPSGEPSAEAVDELPEGWRFCERFADGTQSYVAWVASLATSDVDYEEFRIQDRHMSALRMSATEEARPFVDDYSDPVEAITEVVEAGGGDIQFNTEDYKQAVVQISAYCSDEVGFTR